MSEKQRRIKIGRNEHGFMQAIDTETGQDLAKNATSLIIRIDRSTHFQPVAEITIIEPADVELEADVQIETTRPYKRLERL